MIPTSVCARLLAGLTFTVLLVTGNPSAVAADAAGHHRVTHQFRARLAAVTRVPGSTLMWAVGYAEKRVGEERTHAVRWKDGGWREIPTPSPGMDAELTAVAALSPASVWAVGFFWSSAKVHEPLTLHWNGTAWKRVPTYSGHASLRGVAAVSGSNVWAVGYETTDDGDVPLTLHWTGSSWRKVPCPGIDATLNAVAASGSRVWAVGRLGDEALIDRWNGSSWQRVPAPRPPASELTGVAIAGQSAWAVGNVGPSWSPPRTTLTLRWNGSSWARVASPNPGFDPQLSAVTASSRSNVWAVGDTQADSGWRSSLFLHWNGSKWNRVSSPSSYEGNSLRITGITTTSSTFVLASGFTEGHFDPDFYAYLCRWNGSEWVYWYS